MSRNIELHETAADWLQRLPDKNMSEEELQAWLQWYGASESNREAFDQAQAFYVRLRGMNDRQRAVLREAAAQTPRPAFPFRLNARRVALAAAACVVVVSVVLSVWRAPSQPLAYSAPPDRYRTVQLADGSTMVLGAHAAAKVAYTPQKRSLDVLVGSTYFEVKHDPRRPFVVRVGDISVTAIGTAFSVERDVNRLNVTVTEGSVEVASATGRGSAAAKRLRVKAGERSTFEMSSTQPRAHPPSTDDIHGWSNGSVQFFNAPLGKVVDAVNVYATHRIRIEDPRVTDLNYSGTVFRERIEEWVAALPQIYPVRAVPLDDGSITLVRR